VAVSLTGGASGPRLVPSPGAGRHATAGRIASFGPCPGGQVVTGIHGGRVASKASMAPA